MMTSHVPAVDHVKNLISLGTVSPSSLPKDQKIVTGKSPFPKFNSSGIPTFPFVLHTMLDEADEEGFTNVVSWMGPQSFKVHDRERFTKHILPRYFCAQTKFKSFQRQLAMYGFVRDATNCSGPQKGAYSHEFLLRGNPELCHAMNRIKNKRFGRAPHPLISREGSTTSSSKRNHQEIVLSPSENLEGDTCGLRKDEPLGVMDAPSSVNPSAMEAHASQALDLAVEDSLDVFCKAVASLRGSLLHVPDAIDEATACYHSYAQLQQQQPHLVGAPVEANKANTWDEYCEDSELWEPFETHGREDVKLLFPPEIAAEVIHVFLGMP